MDLSHIQYSGYILYCQDHLFTSYLLYGIIMAF
nr:MAG TPA: hypothetical protein [Caudoviricetes sp.]